MTSCRHLLSIVCLSILSNCSMAQDQRTIRHIIIEDCQNIENDSLKWSQFLTEVGEFEFQEKDNGKSHLELGQLSWRWFDENSHKFRMALLFRDTSNWNYVVSLEVVHDKLLGEDTVLISDTDTCYSAQMIAKHYQLFDEIIEENPFSVSVRWRKSNETMHYFDFQKLRNDVLDNLTHFSRYKARYLAQMEWEDSLVLQEYLHLMLDYIFEETEDFKTWKMFNPSLTTVEISQFKEEAYLLLRDCFPNEFSSTEMFYFALIEQKKWKEIVELICNWDTTNQYKLNAITSSEPGVFYRISRNNELLAFMLDRHKIDSQNPALTYHIALFYDQLGETKKAKKYYTKTVKLDANYYTSFAEIALKKP